MSWAALPPGLKPRQRQTACESGLHNRRTVGLPGTGSRRTRRNRPIPPGSWPKVSCLGGRRDCAFPWDRRTRHEGAPGHGAGGCGGAGADDTKGERRPCAHPAAHLHCGGPLCRRLARSGNGMRQRAVARWFPEPHARAVRQGRSGQMLGASRSESRCPASGRGRFARNHGGGRTRPWQRPNALRRRRCAKVSQILPLPNGLPRQVVNRKW